MTCEEFKAVLNRCKAESKMPTVTEIAAMFIHRGGCKGCFDWLESQAINEKTVEQSLLANNIVSKCHEDPEFIKTVYGEGP